MQYHNFLIELEPTQSVGASYTSGGIYGEENGCVTFMDIR